MLAIIAAVVSILTKAWMYHFTIHNAKKIKSTALAADAWHHRTDMIASLGALIGIILSIYVNPVFDIIASLLITVFIIKVAYEIFMDATDKIVDKACDNDMIEKMQKVVLEQEGVLGIDDLKTRQFGIKIYVDIEISADGSKTLNEVHEISERVQNKIEEEFSDVKHCMVHINPYKPKE